MAARERAQLFGPIDEQSIVTYYEGIGSQLEHRSENRIEITLTTGVQNLKL
jgi:hypothetical protein